MKKQGAGSRVTGACKARVKIGKLLLLVCTCCIPATGKLWASTDAPPTVTSFAYPISHPFTPLPDSVIEKVADFEYEPEESTDYNGFDMPPEPTVDPRTGPPRELSRSGLCSAVASVARAHDLPIPFFANLIWQESSFQSQTISRAGAQGIAQFMPKTAVEFGLINPFEPIHALNVAGKFLRDLHSQFGNLGLAAAAYNAGPRRVTNWMTKGGALPTETRNYVLKITGRPVDQWKSPEIATDPEAGLMPAKAPCVEVAEEVEAQTRLVRITRLMSELSAAAKTAGEAQQVAEREEANATSDKGKRNRMVWAARLAKAQASPRPAPKFASKSAAKSAPKSVAKSAPKSESEARFVSHSALKPMLARQVSATKPDMDRTSRPEPGKSSKTETKVAAKSETPDISSRNKQKKAAKDLAKANDAAQTREATKGSPKQAAKEAAKTKESSKQASKDEKAKEPAKASEPAKKEEAQVSLQIAKEEPAPSPRPQNRRASRRGIPYAFQRHAPI